MRNKKTRIIIILAVYCVCVLALLVFLNGKRKSEYSHTMNPGFFTISAGELSETGGIHIDDSSEFTGEFAYSPGIQLRTGEYDVTVNYHATGENTVHLSVNANYEEYVTLPATETSVTARMTVYPSSDDCRIWLIYSGMGDLTIDSIIITSDIPLYTDFEYFMVLTVLFGILIPLGVYYLAAKKKYTRLDWIRTGILAALSVVVNIPVFFGYLWFGVDMRPHLMRIDGVSACIESHRIPTIIYPNYCNGYGELSCIYPDKFLYLPGFLRNRGVSLIASYDTMHVLVNVAALLIMYECVRYITKKEMPAFVSAAIFTFIPYRLYVMGGASQTLGSGLAMLFFPLVITGLFDIFLREGKKWYLLTIGMAAIICCHILSFGLAIIVCIIVAGGSMIIVRRINKKAINKLILSIVVFAVVTLSMTVPFVYYYRLGLNMGRMSLDFIESINHFYQDFLQENGIFHLIALICAAVMIVCLKRKGFRFKEAYSGFCVLMLIMGFGFFYMSTCLFPWGIFVKIPFIYSKLCMLQFAERFMIVGNPALAIGIGMLFGMFTERVDVTTSLKIMTSAVLGLMVILGSLKSLGSIEECDVLIPDRMTGSFYYRQLGYLPPGTEISYYESPNPDLNDWDGVENISYTKVGTDIHYVYRNSSVGNRIELPLFYYSGYHAYDGKGTELPIRMSETNRIVVDMETGPDEATIDVMFTINPVFYDCAVISTIATLLLFVYILKKDVLK